MQVYSTVDLYDTFSLITKKEINELSFQNSSKKCTFSKLETGSPFSEKPYQKKTKNLKEDPHYARQAVLIVW